MLNKPRVEIQSPLSSEARCQINVCVCVCGQLLSHFVCFTKKRQQGQKIKPGIMLELVNECRNDNFYKKKAFDMN